MFKKIRNLKGYLKSLGGASRELLWAQIWHDTAKGCEWLGEDFGVSPGRWAVGYDYLYVMTRVLEELRPKNVLDIGLGISTSLLSRYFDYYKYDNGKHVVIEHDESWINFYTQRHKISDCTQIRNSPLIEKNVEGYNFKAYKDFSDIVHNRKFDVISIDGPFGSSGKYSRRDILSVIPTILGDSFVVVLDDMHRVGEQNTFEEIKRILSSNGIAYEFGLYTGEKCCGVIVSEDNKFICSM